jgi:glycosyltransferase involved in cell wall biosynthesis
MRRSDAGVLLFCAKSLGWSFPLPWAGYIADLQHKRLPHWFSEKMMAERDRIFTQLLADSPVVIVNSKAVVHDIQEFYPGYKSKLVALPFCPTARLDLFGTAADPEMRAPYQLPPRYFLISNQFTVHKSHETAFKALRLVRDAGYDVQIVCTGDMYDHRWPEHCDNLRALIEKQQLSEHIRFLGFIPKNDQLAIMRGSIAVIQPTLFEGGPGGGAIYDAVSTGTPCIVSDIPVNLEIDIGAPRFFAAGSAEDLAEKMIGMLVDPSPMPDKEETFAKLVARQKEFGGLLLDIANGLAAHS